MPKKQNKSALVLEAMVDKFLAQDGKIDLSGWNGAFEEKASALVKLAKNLEADNVETADTIDELYSLMDRRTKARLILESHLRDLMEGEDLEKFCVGRFNVSLVDEIDVVVEDNALLPDDLVIRSGENGITPLRREIKKRLNDGSAVSGARLVTRKILRIR